MNDASGWVVFWMFISGATIGTMIGFWNTSLDYQQAAIEHGCAAHDPITGEWSWSAQHLLETPTDD